MPVELPSSVQRALSAVRVDFAPAARLPSAVGMAVATVVSLAGRWPQTSSW